MKGEPTPMATFEGRVASLETAVQSQGKLLEDFVRETRTSTESLFTGLRKVTEAVQTGRATNWQQLGVMLSGLVAFGGLVFAAFIVPMQRGQDDARARLDREHDARLEMIHAQELEIRELQVWLKVRKITP